jgi:hypothetical protein
VVTRPDDSAGIRHATLEDLLAVHINDLLITAPAD